MNIRATSRLFRFGLFEADLENARLTRKGVRIRLQEQSFRILAMLLDRAGQVVSREDLRRELWPAGTYVDFDGSLNAALKRLRAALDDDADNPRFIETVPKRGYRFIAPVTLEDYPVATEPEIASALPSPAAQEQTPAIRNAAPSNFRHRRWAAVFGTVAVMLAITAFFVFRRRAAVPSTRPVEANVDVGAIGRSVAVLGFQNATGRSSDAWLSTALAEMLRTELGAGGKLRVVSGENVAQFRITSPWSETDSLSQQTASRIGKALNSDLLVLGSFATLGEPQDGSVRVDFRLQDAQTGEMLYQGAETGSEKQFFGLVAKVGVALRERLGLPVISESEEVSVVSSLPSDPDANRFYSLGLAKLREADVAAAKDLFLQAEKLAPRFPLVHLMLFRTWGGLGYDQKADAEIKTAYQLSAGLPETDRLQVEGAYFGSLKELDKAATAYRALYTLYPDSVDYAEQFIVVLNAQGRREEAFAVLDQLRKLPPPASEDPRIDFWQAQLISYSKGSEAQPFFEKAVAEAASRGQRLLYAHFRLSQCINAVYGDHPQGAVAHCQEAYDIFMAAGNTLLAADALRAMGDRRGATGDLSGAREFYNRALALLSKLGEHEKTGVVLNNMAITYENQGQIEQAEKLFRQAAQTWKECGDSLNEGAALGNLGDIFMTRGELRRAEEQYQRARKQIELTDSNSVAYELYSIAAVRLYQGDIAAANQYATQALSISQARRQTTDEAQVNAVLGDIRLAQDDLNGARQNYQQALALRQQVGNKGGVAENQAALAEISIEEGKLSDAERALRESLAEFQSQKAVMDEIPADTELSRVLLREGKLAEARKVISDASTLTRAIGDPALKLPVAIMGARIEAAELSSRAKSKPDLSDPRRKLQKVLSAAQRLGYYGIECDARLALAELGLRLDPAAARVQLAQLARDAHDHGFNLVSRKASELQRRRS
ncbi:MAG TPA: tetratricopeptide repeat protein [Candidatus Acidoferrales bacterium]|nr:tetratricopeptide repeat protein [Candidatus Acidoferrales bacterium]